MNTTRLYKKSDLKFDPSGIEQGRSTLGRISGPEVSRTLGAGMATFDNAHVEWTVLYDEVIVCRKGVYSLRVDGEFSEALPGDGIWVPENTALTYEGDGAEVFLRPLSGGLGPTA